MEALNSRKRAINFGVRSSHTSRGWLWDKNKRKNTVDRILKLSRDRRDDWGRTSTTQMSPDTVPHQGPRVVWRRRRDVVRTQSFRSGCTDRGLGMWYCGKKNLSGVRGSRQTLLLTSRFYILIRTHTRLPGHVVYLETSTSKDERDQDLET